MKEKRKKKTESRFCLSSSSSSTHVKMIPKSLQSSILFFPLLFFLITSSNDFKLNPNPLPFYSPMPCNASHSPPSLKISFLESFHLLIVMRSFIAFKIFCLKIPWVTSLTNSQNFKISLKTSKLSFFLHQ